MFVIYFLMYTKRQIFLSLVVADIVRRKMQTSGAVNCDEYVTIRQTLQKVYVEEGVTRGFFKGLSMNWVKGPMATGISFASYDTIKHFLNTNLLHQPLPPTSP
jgi:solute carrier family 25, member 42